MAVAHTTTARTAQRGPDRLGDVGVSVGIAHRALLAQWAGLANGEEGARAKRKGRPEPRKESILSGAASVGAA